MISIVSTKERKKEHQIVTIGRKERPRPQGPLLASKKRGRHASGERQTLHFPKRRSKRVRSTLEQTIIRLAADSLMIEPKVSLLTSLSSGSVKLSSQAEL